MNINKINVNVDVNSAGVYLSLTKEEMVRAVATQYDDIELMKERLIYNLSKISESSDSTVFRSKSGNVIAGWDKRDIALLMLVPKEQLLTILTNALEKKMIDYTGLDGYLLGTMVRQVSEQLEISVNLMFETYQHLLPHGNVTGYLE